MRHYDKKFSQKLELPQYNSSFSTLFTSLIKATGNYMKNNNKKQYVKGF